VVLHELGFIPSKAENNIWMRSRSNHYEYIVHYVDDLAIVSQNPQEIIDKLKDSYNFKLKGTGPNAYHLGTNFERDQDRILCMSP